LIFHGALNDSRLVVWAFDLAESNLPARLALPLLAANSLDLLLSQPLPAVVSLGERVAVDADLSVTGPGGRTIPSAPTGTVVADQPGLYTLRDAQSEPVSAFAAHAGSALESNLDRRVGPALLEWEGGAPARAAAAPDPDLQELWPLLGSLVLFLLLLEGWLAWRN
jgi:hypothetical protein